MKKYNKNYQKVQADEISEFGESTEELIKKFKKSFFLKHKKEYTSAFEEIDTLEKEEVFKQVLFDEMLDGELKVLYDDALIDDSAIVVAFKHKNQLVYQYLFDDDETKKFVIDDLFFNFEYPKSKKMSVEDKTLLFEELTHFNKKHNLFSFNLNTKYQRNKIKPKNKRRTRLLF